MTSLRGQTTAYGRFLLLIAGIGGLLYGIDIGIISAALLYLNRTISLTEQQTSFIVAAVLGGSMGSSLIAGVLADRFGRKRMMITSGLMFVASVGSIVLSQSFVPLFLGRLLQGMSGGVIAVVVPLYLAECLGANSRGRGTAIFQFMLTLGIVVAALAGLHYTQHAEAAIAAAAGDAALIGKAQNEAWRGMFLSVIYPGFLFFLGACFLSESPRWLFRRGYKEEALAALRRSCSEEEAELEIREMEMATAAGRQKERGAASGSLLQRKYVAPFILACIILGCNQATGINSILQFLVVILKQAGMSASLATRGDVAVKALNCVMTLVAVTLVDRKGRKYLLKLGTGGIIVALVSSALIFRGFESKRIDIRDKLRGAITNDSLILPLSQAHLSTTETGRPMCLTVLYSYGEGDKVATVLSNDRNPFLSIVPERNGKNLQRLVIKRAQYGPVPTELTGWLITGFLSLFIASFSLGPGVCVWLALTELMPTRIRSTGMGIALLINQGVSTAIAAAFLPTVGNYGYSTMFFFWAGCTVVYFVTAAFFLPETKGRTLEEIEEYFETGKVKTAAVALAGDAPES